MIEVDDKTEGDWRPYQAVTPEQVARARVRAEYSYGRAIARRGEGASEAELAELCAIAHRDFVWHAELRERLERRRRAS